MATWKEMRALEAAARAAEAQRQAESARGARELRGLERFLGSVDQLIGMAPGAIEGYQAGEAQKVLAGERPLEQPAPKKGDILQETGAFISGLFEPGVQRKVKEMAAEQAPARLQQIEPLLREAIKKPGVKAPETMTPETKGAPYADFGAPIISPEVKFAPREAARAELMKDSALALLPPQQQEAALAGLEQRMSAEQAAAVREQELFGLQKRKIEAEAGAKEAQAKKFLTEAESKQQQVAPARMKELSKAIVMGVRSFAQNLKDGLNSTDPKVRGKAIDELNQQVMLEAGNIRNNDGTLIGQDSPLAMAAASEAVAEISKELEMPKLATSDLGEFADAKNTIEEVASLVERRKNLGDFPVGAVDVIAKRFAKATPKMLGARDFMEESRKLALESGMTNEQFSWLKDAEILKNRLIIAEFRGTGALSDDERASISDEVLTPIATYENFRQRAYDTLVNVSNRFVGRVNVYREANQIPSTVTSFADRLGEIIGGDREGVALRIIGEVPTGGKEAAYTLDGDTGAKASEKLLKAPGSAIKGVAVMGYEVLADVIQRAIGGGENEFQLVANGVKKTFTTEKLAEMAKKNPNLFKTLISQNPDAAKQIQEVVGGKQ